MKPGQTLCDVGKLCSRKLEFMPFTMEGLAREPLPFWFLSKTGDQKRLIKALNDPETSPTSHDSVQVVWDRDRLKDAVFETKRPT